MSRFRAHSTLVCIAVIGAASVFGGCRKPLLSPDEERSQYDRYDAVRNQRAPQSVYDEFGRKRPNLRPRLLSQE